MKLKRVTGFDVAVALLVPVALYYIFHLGIGQNKGTFRRDQFNLIFDGAVAAFVFINGISLGLSMASGEYIDSTRRYFILRGLTFIGIGLLVDLSGMPHIFTLLGLLSIGASAFVPLSSSLLRVLTTVLLTIAFYFYFLTDIRINIEATQGTSVVHYLAHHTLYGYYSLLSWAPFFVGGVLFSRQLLNRHFKPGLLGVKLSVVIVVIGVVVEILLSNRFPNLGGKSASPYPFMQLLQFLYPSFTITAFGLSLAIANLAVAVNEHSESRFKALLRNYGKVKYSVLLAALIAGWFATLLLAGNQNFGYRTVALFTLVVWGISFAGTAVWLRYFSTGPVEMLLRAISPGK
jgi:hypothetical protein